MNRDEYLSELDEAGREVGRRAREAAGAANPLNGLRDCVAGHWKWWLPAAAVAGFALAQAVRAGRGRGGGAPGAASGAAFWVPMLIKLLPAMTAQVVPLILSLRTARKP